MISLNEEVLRVNFEKATSKSALCLALFGYVNRAAYVKLKDISVAYKLDLSELDKKYITKRTRHPKQVVKCPVCSTPFETAPTAPKVKKTCSHACANTFFRSGLNSGNYKGDEGKSANRYRTICFAYHKKECVVCSEGLVVEVHHFDEDNANNAPENLIPLCPTHHKYWHSKHKWVIEEKVNAYRVEFAAAQGIILSEVSTLVKLRIQKERRARIFKNLGLEKRVAIRPPHAELLAIIASLGYSGTGRKYGVSDNAVRKWVKAYAATASSSVSRG